ncbi:LacI family DNA-binding transcriptional regulator [Macrococcus sp. EM39E]|uniref:LacI family DNA-binding transcriptional regulator n=1 Tax=Macrococcus animalis TaxID=3395467 RepID=UPI0039BDE3CE
MVSSKEVAKQAGVSQSTVSRVINNPKSVKKDKRERVERVMKELNYRPNSIARSLISNKTNQISLISGTLNSPFFVESTKYIVDYASAHGFHVNVYFEEEAKMNNVYDNVFANTTDGIILSSMYYESEHFEEFENLNIPYIMYNRKHKNGGNYVEMDNYNAGREAVKFLKSKGHENILYLGGLLNKSTFKDRLSGYKDELKNQGMPINDENIIVTQETYDSIEPILIDMFNRENKPTAIFATTDMIALFVFDILSEHGYSIPDDFALISIDNTETMQHRHFNLTSIGVKTEETMAQVAITKLIDAIVNNEKLDCQLTLPIQVFDRGTV